ncbi:MAG: glycosyl transferase, group 1 [Acidobacteriaceae bacterium]|nr:glycosyl transferase, group 1 [Acidobacteriaceae bacterium]
MSGRLKFRIFAHSWISDWNHGNAHFLRGLANELVNLGHEVRCYEEENSWSAANLRQEGDDLAEAATRQFRQAFPLLDVRFYRNDSSFPAFAERELREAGVVIVHEWNPIEIVETITSLKSKLGFVALFHDTHHRAYTNPKQILRMPIHLFDGVLAFGEAIRRIYADGFGVERTWNFQEAADIAHFKPLPAEKYADVVWVGNWGDEERSRELEEFLIGPALNMRDRKIAVYGVRYPEPALKKLDQAGIEYRGYLPNLEAPRVYARSVLSLHVPRKFYANGLSGIPTIRMFEVMACGSPLICSPWTDSEKLFRPSEDYVCVPDRRSVAATIQHLLRDETAREQLANNGLETIRKRHTCAHRAQELVEICGELGR